MYISPYDYDDDYDYVDTRDQLLNEVFEYSEAATSDDGWFYSDNDGYDGLHISEGSAGDVWFND